MTLADILSTDNATGRAAVTVPGFPVTVVLACHARDIHAMPGFQKWLVGALTPGMTWRNGTAINEGILVLQTARDIIDLFLHEDTHGWQLWRRMGPDDFPAGYIGQIITKFFGWLLDPNPKRTNLHDRINIEKEAIDSAAAMMVEIDALLKVSQPVRYDALPWLTQHLPALR